MATVKSIVSAIWRLLLLLLLLAPNTSSHEQVELVGLSENPQRLYTSWSRALSSVGLHSLLYSDSAPGSIHDSQAVRLTLLLREVCVARGELSVGVGPSPPNTLVYAYISLSAAAFGTCARKLS